MKLTCALVAGVVALAGAWALAANAQADQKAQINAHAAQSVTVLGRSVLVRDGVAPIGLRCRSASCVGTLQLQGLRTARGLYGAVGFSLNAGRQTVLKARLTPAGRQLLNTGLSVLVWATVTLRGSSSPALRVQLTLTRFIIIASRWHQGFNKFWSGYAVTGQRFRAVRGTFVQPSMTSCSASSARSPGAPIVSIVFIWSGLDGLGSYPIEQVGTEIVCVIPSAGPPSIGYYAWYETFPVPDAVRAIPVAIHPGDTISTEVRAVSPQHFAMSLEDRSTASGWSQVLYQPTRAPQLSAEWIDEVQGVAMPSITTTTWSSVSTTARGTTAAIGQPPNAEVSALTISDTASRQHIQPSPLSAAGDAFNISWLPGASP